VLSQAVILCGPGRDSATPEPLALRPIGGKPFLEHLIQDASRFGIDRITILTDAASTGIGALYDGKTLHHCAIEVIAVPAGANPLRAARDRLAPDFLLLNGACWSDADLVVLAHRWHGARSAQPSLAGMVLMQPPLAAIRDGADAASPGTLINTGVHILRRDALAPFWAQAEISLDSILATLSTEGRLRIQTAPANSAFLDLRDSARFFAHRLMARRTRPALFLDRDGTLNVDRGYTFRPADLVWQSEAREAVRHANRAGYYVFVVTNQSGVSRGFFTAADVEAFHAAMQDSLFEIEAHIDALEWCPHHVDGTIEHYKKPCRRRKPAPGMIEDLAATWPVDLSRSLMIGDRDIDMEAAQAAGITGILFEGGSLLDIVQRHVPRD